MAQPHNLTFWGAMAAPLSCPDAPLLIPASGIAIDKQLAAAEGLVVILCGMRPRENRRLICDFAAMSAGTLTYPGNHNV